METSPSSSEKRQCISQLAYPPHHWVLQPLTLTDLNVVALVYFQQCDYAVYLNPSDKRGYRSIVRLINNDRMLSTINREYTSSERIGLALSMAMVTDAYARIVPIAQNVVAGNNAHSFDPQTGTVHMGTVDEPIFLHGHVYGRGNPKENYIADVPLDGPVPGLVFDLRAQSSHELGNEVKISWKPIEMERVVRRLKSEIERIYPTYQAHGLTVMTEQKFTDIYIVRHGQTDWNVQRKLQGHTDIPLNEQGRLQAQQLHEQFASISFTKVVSSDLARAHSTAALIVGTDKAVTIETSPLLRERCFGTWEGRLATDLQVHLKQTFDLENLTQEEYLALKWEDTVESYADVYQRMQTWFRSVSGTMKEGPVLLATHGGVLRAILSRLNYQPGFRWMVTNGAFLKLRLLTDGQIIMIASEGVKLIHVGDAILSC